MKVLASSGFVPFVIRLDQEKHVQIGDTLSVWTYSFFGDVEGRGFKWVIPNLDRSGTIDLVVISPVGRPIPFYVDDQTTRRLGDQRLIASHRP